MRYELLLRCIMEFSVGKKAVGGKGKKQLSKCWMQVHF